MFPSFESILPSLQPSIVEMKQHRKKAKRNILLSIVVFSLLGVVCFIYVKHKVVLVFPLFIIVMLSRFIFLILENKFIRLYANRLVSQLIEKMFQKLDPTVDDVDVNYHASYIPERHITREEINQSNLFLHSSSVSGEDYIEGQIGLTTFKFSEVHIMERDTDSDGKESTSTRFKGVVFIADFHKKFAGSTYIFRRRFFNKTNVSADNVGAFQIELTDNEFNKAFATMTTDDIEARYILSTNFACKILEYSNRLNGKVEFAFVDSRMFIFRESKKDHFSGKLFNSNDEEVLQQIYEDFLEYFSLIDELTLNRRIWSKD